MTKRLILTTVALGLLTTVWAKDSLLSSSFKSEFSSVSPLEIPAKAAAIVGKASDKEREAVTIAVVKSAIEVNPTISAAAVSSIARTSPEMAPVAAGTAAALQPKMAPAIARAAASAAPAQAEKIVFAVCKAVPAQYRSVVLGVAQTVAKSDTDIGPPYMINGGFEAGTFTGWQQRNDGDGAWAINDGTLDPPGPEGRVAPVEGRFSAVAQQNGPGTRTLYQTVTVPVSVSAASLTWSHRVRNYGPSFSSSQGFRVEIRTDDDVFLAVAYATQAGDPLLGEWTRQTFDLLAFRGQPIRIVFIEDNTLGYCNVHLDDVQVLLGLPGTPMSLLRGLSAAVPALKPYLDQARSSVIASGGELTVSSVLVMSDTVIGSGGQPPLGIVQPPLANNVVPPQIPASSGGVTGPRPPDYSSP